MKRLLVTGAAGFVGRQVLAMLGGSEWDVHAVSSSTRAPTDGVTWHRVDLLDQAQRAALVAQVRPDALLHLAWHARPPHYWTAEENVDWLGASLDLFRLVHRHGGTRVIGVGSCTEYDWRHGYFTEGITPLFPSTLYGSTKAACGSVLVSYAREAGLSAAWARPFFMFGPHDSPLRLVPSLVQALAAGRPATCNAGGHVRDFLHVADVADALVALLRSNVTGPVNIGSGSPLRIGDIARRIANALERPDLITIADGSPENMMVCANVARLRDEVGWRPTHAITARLDETIRWWRSPEAVQVSG